MSVFVLCGYLVALLLVNMSSAAETDAEDVNDFLKRIQELGTKRDQEDEERNRKLEEEILQGRKERQARRAGVCTLAAFP